jgi:hypothetical protein
VGDVVNLRSTPIDLLSDTGRQFVVDCTRAGEGLINDQELAEKYELSPADWQSIKKDTVLANAVRAERERRVLNGTAARESAARHFVKMPTILAGIAENQSSNPRHVIEAAKEIRATAAVSSVADRPAGTEMFIIKIDLTAGGGPVETYEKTISIDTPSEGKPDGTE